EHCLVPVTIAEGRQGGAAVVVIETGYLPEAAAVHTDFIDSKMPAIGRADIPGRPLSTGQQNLPGVVRNAGAHHIDEGKAPGKGLTPGQLVHGAARRQFAEPALPGVPKPLTRQYVNFTLRRGCHQTGRRGSRSENNVHGRPGMNKLTKPFIAW